MMPSWFEVLECGISWDSRLLYRSVRQLTLVHVIACGKEWGNKERRGGNRMQNSVRYRVNGEKMMKGMSRDGRDMENDKA